MTILVLLLRAVFEPTREAQPQPKTFFLKDAKGFPVACVAVLVDSVTPPGYIRMAYYSLSTYNPHDEFSKTVAQNVAIERLMTKPLGFTSVTPGMHRRIVDHIYHSRSVPKRARDAAFNWLQTHPPRRFQ